VKLCTFLTLIRLFEQQYEKRDVAEIEGLIFWESL